MTSKPTATDNDSDVPQAESPDAARHFMLDHITRNSNQIVYALVKKAVAGHYQAARFLLDELTKMSDEQDGEGCRSIAEILLPITERLFARPATAPAAESDSESASEAADEATDSPEKPPTVH